MRLLGPGRERPAVLGEGDDLAPYALVASRCSTSTAWEMFGLLAGDYGAPRLARHHGLASAERLNQFSTIKPANSPKSPALRVTRTKPLTAAMAAI